MELRIQQIPNPDARHYMNSCICILLNVLEPNRSWNANG
jgi:hypothetical protein